MVKENEKQLDNTVQKLVLLGIKDDLLNVFEHCFLLNEKLITYYFIELVNSPDSKYFNTPNTYSLYRLGIINTKSGEFINNDKEYLHNLSEFIDDVRRQRILDLRTLNFVPQGFEQLPKSDREKLINEKNRILEKLLKEGVKDEEKVL